MATARNVLAVIVLGLSGSGFAQSPPAAPVAAGTAATDAPVAKSEAATKKAKSESPGKTPPAARGTGAVAPAGDAAARKTFNESRSNTTRATDGAKATDGGAKATDGGANSGERKSFFESRSNTAKRATDAGQLPASACRPPPSTAAPRARR